LEPALRRKVNEQMPRPVTNAKPATQGVLFKLIPGWFSQQNSDLFARLNGLVALVSWVSPFPGFLDLVGRIKSELYFLQHRRKT
jgi:hypothetical protein